MKHICSAAILGLALAGQSPATAADRSATVGNDASRFAQFEALAGIPAHRMDAAGLSDIKGAFKILWRFLPSRPDILTNGAEFTPKGRTDVSRPGAIFCSSGSNQCSILPPGKSPVPPGPSL